MLRYLRESASSLADLLVPLLLSSSNKEEEAVENAKPKAPRLTYGVCVVMKPTNAFMRELFDTELKDRIYVHFVNTVPTSPPHAMYWYRDLRKLRAISKPQFDLVVVFDGCAWDREFMLSDDFMRLVRYARLWNIVVIVTISDPLQMAPESREHVNMRYRQNEETGQWEFQSARE